MIVWEGSVEEPQERSAAARRSRTGLSPAAAAAAITVLATVAACVVGAGALSGCGSKGSGGGATSEPSRDSFRGDPSKLTPDQRKQMMQAMQAGSRPVPTRPNGGGGAAPAAK